MIAKLRNLTSLTTLALVLVLSGAAVAADYDVNQSSLTFDPAVLNIQVGDTVNWHWTSGSHTVTNGSGPGDPDVGLLFDAPLDGANTTFSYTFNTAGTFPYFCRPHFSLDMTGTIIVEETVAAETTSLDAVKNLFR